MNDEIKDALNNCENSLIDALDSIEDVGDPEDEFLVALHWEIKDALETINVYRQTQGVKV